MDIKGIDIKSSCSSDKIFLERMDVLKLCDSLFGSGSVPDKVWDWLQKENSHLKELKHINLNKEGIRFLSAHLTRDRVSLSYLLEYLLKDFLKNQKRHIQRLESLEKLKSTQHDIPIKPRMNNSSQKSPSGDDMHNSATNPNNMASIGNDFVDSHGMQYESVHYNVNAHKINCIKCKWEAKDLSSPNFKNFGPDVDSFGLKEQKKKVNNEIDKMVNDMAGKKAALAKALALLRVIDPFEIGAYRKVNDIKNVLRKIENLGQVDDESLNKLSEIIGKDGDDLLANGSHLKTNLYDDLLIDHQRHGVKLDKQFRQHC